MKKVRSPRGPPHARGERTNCIELRSMTLEAKQRATAQLGHPERSGTLASESPEPGPSVFRKDFGHRTDAQQMLVDVDSGRSVGQGLRPEAECPREFTPISLLQCATPVLSSREASISSEILRPWVSDSGERGKPCTLRERPGYSGASTPRFRSHSISASPSSTRRSHPFGR